MATVSEKRVLKHRVIERPRLFALLDDTKARIRTLVAPAGYGKTTLAEQWVARDGRARAWYTARTASTDVAALALGLARSCTVVVDGCDSRLREHLRALPAPAENVETLAEILGEELAAWPVNAWLVFDDYHEVAEEPEAERFVAALIAASPVNFLIASRQRPSWVTSKGLLYGEVLELNQTSLAMDNHEAAQMLSGRSAPSASGLVSVANGWPALIGLASVSDADLEDTDPEEHVPEALYRFFAEEVFGSLGIEVQQGLTTLSVAPILDRQLAAELLGPESGESVCAAALDVGILVERGSQLDLHPLARAFLADRSGQLGLEAAEDAVRSCLEYYRARREWDAAFEVLLQGGPVDELTDLTKAALDELLDTARLSTVQRWCELAQLNAVDGPIFAIARAEVMLRHGKHVEAMAHAEGAADHDTDLAFRALSLAGRAAHLASREEEGLRLYRRAEEAATTDSERRDAKWGEFICAVELEMESATESLQQLRANVTLTDPRDAVRAAAYELSYQVKLGNLDLHDADLASTLLDRVGDALIVSAFQSTYSAVLGLVARYEEALEVARSLLDTIEAYRLDFATPYALCAAALATAGMRRWDESRVLLDEAIRFTRVNRDGHAEQLCTSQLIRVLIQQGKHEEALVLRHPIVRAPLPAAQAELEGSRALALASLGRLDDARLVADEIRGLSRAVEPDVLIRAVDAVCALKSHAEDSIERVLALEETAFTRGAVDILVTAYRSTPELLRILMKGSPKRARVESLVRMASDFDIARVAGVPVLSGGDARLRLSPREREVYELIVDELTNREIAKLLFIEESTVKRHAQNIYDKLGVRSRVALTVQAALERADQATSAMDSSDSSDSEESEAL
jgi:ATP/maltotriose-dependent transcriptional regulator MalT